MTFIHNYLTCEINIQHNDTLFTKPLPLQEKNESQAMTITSLEETLLGITREKKDSEMKLQKMKSVLKGMYNVNFILDRRKMEALTG